MQVRQLEVGVRVDERRQDDGAAEGLRIGRVAAARLDNAAAVYRDPAAGHRVVSDRQEPVSSVTNHPGAG
ncbi:hypothetical protein D3C83_154280 [compost metagenome]